jgi:tRNA pseudouridine38-40 synthase
MRTIKLTISYVGTNYIGWQVQPKGVSIQGIIQKALKKLAGDEASVIAAGRTDAGVHALHQVAHIITESKIPCDGIRMGLNSLLPNDIAIVEAKDVAKDFHARKSAKGKRYIYKLLLSKNREPLLEDRCWRIGMELDLSKMERSSKYLLGKNDFSSFRASKCAANDAVRTITKIEFKRRREQMIAGKGVVIDITFEGDGFVRHMIRNIVGTLVDIGAGRLDMTDMKSILKARERKKAGVCAPACGLYLAQVFY